MEEFWEFILSRSPQKIISAYKLLSDQEKQSVIKHLIKMSSEEGWQPGQKISAETAIKIIRCQENNFDY